MKTRSFGISLLAVIGLSIVFGIVLGGFIHSPRTAHAVGPAEPGLVQLAPAATRSAGIRDFADVVEESMEGVVGVTAQNDGSSDEDGAPNDDQRRELFEFFFGPDGMPRGQEPREQRPRIGEGTGFVISTDGYILTNNHVVEDADRVKVAFSDGTEESARVVGTDPSIDLALLKVEKRGLKALPLGDSEQLRVGEWVIAIGNPLEFEQTVTVGVLSAKNRRVPLPSTDQQGLVTFLQTDAAINFGNSGGPLLDIDGNVVGINTAITRQNLAEGIGFALPIDQARRVVNQLRDFGQVRRGYIGIGMNTAGIDADSQEYFKLPDRFGVIVDSVRDDSPAADAGLQPFDVIRSVDGKKVIDNDDLIARISSYMPGDSVDLEIYRSGRPLELTATLAERPQGNAIVPASTPVEPEEEPEPAESTGLGITVQAIDDAVRGQMGLDPSIRGVLVTDVEFDSLAAEKGLVRNFIVIGLNDEPIESVSDWDRALGKLRRGQPVKVDVTSPRGNRASFFLRAQ